MAEFRIPTIDLAPFFNGDENGKKTMRSTITEACADYGFFQIENHGVPLDLISRAISLSTAFFALPDEEKLMCSPGTDAPLPAGFSKQPEHSPDKNEYLLMFSPTSNLNVMPSNPPDFKGVLEEMFGYLSKLGEVIESTVNSCLDLPPNFLKQYNQDRTWDFMVALHYNPATDTENNGISEHEDGNVITFVIQDEVGGLEVKKDGEWIPVIPSPAKIVVNVGDVIQVVTNNKFKSATHRVVRRQGKRRHSFAFFYNIHGDKWIEPFAELSEEIGEPKKYRGFYYKEYQSLRLRNKTHPPSRPQDVIHITHYAINE